MSEMSSESADPNLTPLLDLVFQLITFFMLVINLKGASLDLSLKLPVLGSARPVEQHGKLEPMLLNIDPAGRVHAYGREIDVEAYVAKEARLLTEQLKQMGTPVQNGEMPVGVTIRADRAAPFHLVNHVLKTCQEKGYRQFSLNAMTREGK